MEESPDRTLSSLRLGSIAVGAIAGLAPIVWNPFGVQAFLHPKLLVLGLGIALAGLAVAKTGSVFPGSASIRVALLGFVAVALAATALADAPLIALFGSGIRQLGLVTWLGHIVVGLLAMQLATKWQSEMLCTAAIALVLGQIVVSGFAILESLDASPFDFSQSFGGRVQSVMGNPAVVGAYLVLGLPIAVALAIDTDQSLWRRAVAVFAVAMAVPSLLLAGSRGAWLGAAIGIAVFAVALLRSRSFPKWAVGAIGLLILMAVVVSLSSGRWQTLGAAGEGRFALWEVGIEAAWANPVLGVGPDNFAFEFGEHVDESFVLEYSRDQVYDRAHNGIIDVAVAFGIPGAAMYLVIIGGVLAIAYRAVRSGDALLVGAGAGVGGYLVQQQVHFQVSVIDAAFWLVVGLLGGTFSRNRRARPLDRWIRITAVSLGVFIAIYAALGIQADHFDKRALATAEPVAALGALELAAALRPFDNVHYTQAVGIAREVQDVHLVRDALDFVRSGRRWSPTDELLILGEVNVLNQLFRLTGDVRLLDSGDRLLIDLVQRDPTNGEAYLRLGTSAYYRGDATGAEASWRQAEVLLPNSAAPRANLEILYAELGR